MRSHHTGRDYHSRRTAPTEEPDMDTDPELAGLLAVARLRAEGCTEAAAALRQDCADTAARAAEYAARGDYAGAYGLLSCLPERAGWLCRRIEEDAARAVTYLDRVRA